MGWYRSDEWKELLRELGEWDEIARDFAWSPEEHSRPQRFSWITFKAIELAARLAPEIDTSELHVFSELWHARDDAFLTPPTERLWPLTSDNSLKIRLLRCKGLILRLEAIGTVSEKPNDAPKERPEWKKGKSIGELTFRGDVIRKVKISAAKLVPILDGFQELGWPDTALSPLSDDTDGERLRSALKQLNNGLTLIKFHATGDKRGAGWYPL
ncbi:MAG: hypothetical protein SGJ19_05000 [Planctomycetia bacterium]|nr:hypothetical protein [Planctomycetia bacterium]